MLTAYLESVAVALDQLGNALLGGSPDETISARAYRNGLVIRQRLINMIFNDPEHCKTAYESEMRRSQLPKEYR